MIIRYEALPGLNAMLNSVSAGLLLAGFGCIRAGWVAAHRACMTAALCASTLFLASYLTYHAHVGSVHFPGQGLVRPVYFTLLASHTCLAALIVPLALRTFYLAVRRRVTAHRAIARWTLPLWLYVSVTGVIIYWMLYRVTWT